MNPLGALVLAKRFKKLRHAVSPPQTHLGPSDPKESRSRTGMLPSRWLCFTRRADLSKCVRVPSPARAASIPQPVQLRLALLRKVGPVVLS